MNFIVFISIIATLVSSIKCDKKPTFTKNFKKIVTVKEGDPFLLGCYANGSPVPKIRWERFQNTTHDNSPITKKLINGNVLYKSTTSRLDEGLYRCIADNGVGDPIETTYMLYVDIRPKVFHSMQHIDYSSFNITCIAEADPIAPFIWYKDGKVIYIDPTDDTLEIEHKTEKNSYTVKSTIYINTTFAKNEGFYKCVIANKLGKDEQEFATLKSYDRVL